MDTANFTEKDLDVLERNRKIEQDKAKKFPCPAPDFGEDLMDMRVAEYIKSIGLDCSVMELPLLDYYRYYMCRAAQLEGLEILEERNKRVAATRAEQERQAKLRRQPVGQ